MAEARGEPQIDQEPPVEPGIEMQDIHYWIEQIDNYVQESQAMNNRMNHALQQIRDTVAAQERLNETAEIQAEDIESVDSEKLSATALTLIQQTSGPLTPVEFHEFLMHSSYRKPQPPVLPIIRGYCNEVDAVRRQLLKFRLELKRAHNEYKLERRKDENLEKRIDRLVGNIMKERNVENRDGLHQSSIRSYTSPT